MKTHTYDVGVNWTGNDGEGTTTYRSYRRDHTIIGGTKLAIPGSSDPAFRGDPTRYSPEELLVGSLSACHMLWYLHLCSVNGIVVIDYRDAATGTMEETQDGSGAFTHMVLKPSVTIAAGCDVAKAGTLHDEAHRLCFIANSVKFEVTIDGTVVAGPE